MTISVLLSEPEAVIHDVLTKTIVVLLFGLQDLLSLNQIMFLPDHIAFLPEQGVLSSLQNLHFPLIQRDNSITLGLILPVLYL